MKAIGKHIVIKEKKEKSSSTKGGLILGEKQREDIRYRQAEVLNVGTDVIVINKGDNIYFDRHAGFNIEIKNKILKVIQEHDVVIIL
jgi:co-chaperonin GroES (HSP10)